MYSQGLLQITTAFFFEFKDSSETVNIMKHGFTQEVMGNNVLQKMSQVT